MQDTTIPMSTRKIITVAQVSPHDLGYVGDMAMCQKNINFKKLKKYNKKT